MGKPIDLAAKFLEYFHELEGYALRSERFYASFDSFSSREALGASMVLWLEAAYLQGARDIAQDTIETLGDYATSLAGIEELVYTREDAYDAAAESLAAYYSQVLKD